MNKKIKLALLLLWCLLIFALSQQIAGSSNELSKDVTGAIINVVTPIIPNSELSIQSFNNVVRKNAHFFAYLVLGILISSIFNENQNKYFKWILLGCVLYAVTDEVHQLFIPGRGCRITDVLIDGSGSLVGMLLYLAWKWLRKKYFNRLNN
jgi:VanZ family protein